MENFLWFFFFFKFFLIQIWKWIFSVSFFLKSHYFPLNLWKTFHWIENCRVPSFFIPSALKILFYFLLACIDCDKKSAVILIFVHLHVICHFYSVALRFSFTQPMVFRNVIMMCLDLILFLLFLFVCLFVWILLIFFIWGTCFYQIQKF